MFRPKIRSSKGSTINAKSQNPSRYSKSSSKAIPAHPAIIITSDIKSSHIQKLKEGLSLHNLKILIQTSRKRVSKPASMPTDKYFSIVDNRYGPIQLTGQFSQIDRSNYCRVDYPNGNTIQKIIRQYNEFFSRGKQLKKRSKIQEQKIDNADNQKPLESRQSIKLKHISINAQRGTSPNLDKVLYIYKKQLESEDYLNYIDRFSSRKDDKFVFIHSIDQYLWKVSQNGGNNNYLLVGENTAKSQLNRFGAKKIFLYGSDMRRCSSMNKQNISYIAFTPESMDILLKKEGFQPDLLERPKPTTIKWYNEVKHPESVINRSQLENQNNICFPKNESSENKKVRNQYLLLPQLAEINNNRQQFFQSQTRVLSKDSHLNKSQENYLSIQSKFPPPFPKTDQIKINKHEASSSIKHSRTDRNSEEKANQFYQHRYEFKNPRFIKNQRFDTIREDNYPSRQERSFKYSSTKLHHRYYDGKSSQKLSAPKSSLRKKSKSDYSKQQLKTATGLKTSDQVQPLKRISNSHNICTKDENILYLVEEGLPFTLFDKISDLPDLNDTMYIFTAVKDLSRRVRKGVEAYDLVLVFLCDETDIPALQYANCFFVKERMFFEDEIQTNNCTLYIDDIRKLPQHFSTLCKARISAVKENRITHIYYKEFNRAISYFSKALKQKFRNAEFRKYFGVQDLPTVLPSFQSNEFVLLLTDEVGFREMEEYLIHQLRNNVKFLSICIPKSKEFAKLCKRQSHRAPIIWFTENETRDIYFVLKSIQSFIRYKK